MKHFGPFPDDKFIPKSIRPTLDRYLELRTDADAAGGELLQLRKRIQQAEQEDINDAATALASGKDTKAGTKKHDAAVKAVQDAERQRQALNKAVIQVNAEVQQAFAAAADEIFEIADTEFERTSGAYIAAIETLVTARREWAEAVAARQYAEQVTHGQNEASYRPQRIDEADYAHFKEEAALSADLLFTPRVRQTGAIHNAHHVQQLLMTCHIPSFASGNTLTILESDFDRAIERITRLSDWYADLDGLSRDTNPVDHLVIERVPDITDGMKRQCHWMRG